MDDRPPPIVTIQPAAAIRGVQLRTLVVVVVETRFGDVDFACGAREGVKRAVAQSILPPSEPPDERSRERRTHKRSVWVVSGRGDFLEYFHGHALGVCWSRTATRGRVVPPSQEGLDVLDAASWGGDGGFLLGSALLILTQVAALAVWYQPVPGFLGRLPGTG